MFYIGWRSYNIKLFVVVLAPVCIQGTPLPISLWDATTALGCGMTMVCLCKNLGAPSIARRDTCWLRLAALGGFAYQDGDSGLPNGFAGLSQ